MCSTVLHCLSQITTYNIQPNCLHVSHNNTYLRTYHQQRGQNVNYAKPSNYVYKYPLTDVLIPIKHLTKNIFNIFFFFMKQTFYLNNFTFGISSVSHIFGQYQYVYISHELLPQTLTAS